MPETRPSDDAVVIKLTSPISENGFSGADDLFIDRIRIERLPEMDVLCS
jgi:hypothetical protein